MSIFITIVLDGLGIGEAPDVAEVRPQDKGSNTLLHIVEQNKNLSVPTLEKLGIFNAMRYDSEQGTAALYSRIRFAHEGADTFAGHQELMGTKPFSPARHTLNSHLEETEKLLIENGHKVRRFGGPGLWLLIVDEAMVVGDNMESDPGNAINVTGSISLVPFKQIREVGMLVRSRMKVSRVIAFAGRGVTLEQILTARVARPPFIGIGSAASGVYKEDYHCVHIGYKTDSEKQLPALLHRYGVETCLIGKAADLIANPHGESYPAVPTKDVLEKVLTLMREKRGTDCFICANVQETDLSGHSQSVARYSEVLEIADQYIGRIADLTRDGDILTVIADHGNDPTMSSRHTREYVPLLVHAKGSAKRGQFPQQNTLACVAATAAEFFGCDYNLFGTSFLSYIR